MVDYDITAANEVGGVMIQQIKTNQLAKQVVLVDGIARAGKTLVSALISSFQHVEIQRMHSSFDFVGASYTLGNIEKNAAVTFLRHLADEFSYSGYLSRDVNFRWRDNSSVFKSPKRNLFLARLFNNEGADTVQKILDDGHYYQNLSHDMIRAVPLFYEAWGEGFKMIEIIRHPVDLADAWLRRGFGHRFVDDPMMLTPSVLFGKKAVPFYALGWEQEYLEASGKERVIKMLHGLQLEHRSHYRSFSRQQKQIIKVVRFEDLVTNTHHEVSKLAKFLNTSATRSTKKSIKQQKCPRHLDDNKRADKYARLTQQLDGKFVKLLDEMIEHYREEW